MPVQAVPLHDVIFFGRPITSRLFFHGNGLAKFFKSSAFGNVQDRHASDVRVVNAGKDNYCLIIEVLGGRSGDRTVP